MNEDNIRPYSSEELQTMFKEINNKSPLPYIIYFIKNSKEGMFPFVRVFDTDEGYLIKDIFDDDKIIAEVNALQVAPGNESFTITEGELAGLEFSCKDEDIIILTELLFDAYRAEQSDDKK